MFKQVELSYGFDALEPHIDELTMVTHYTKHHAGYTKNLNAAIEKDASLQDKSIEDILRNIGSVSDDKLRTAVRNNGGGYLNHNLYFSILSPKAKLAPEGELAQRINADFGSLESLKEELQSQAAGRFGSGWAFLLAKTDGSLQVVNTPNQDSPLMDPNGGIPILGIDVWEHAYYLKYKNLRADYLKAIWNVLDWSKVEENYKKATI
ncbi:superoxide dismutase [Pleomorphochaeta sp. DL1XJH-081]|uniref:superoxide dismutase n=1 Tax=Pleomorphochaeta sp. DL1XJH-081 TaxID=3409690 RepID=UPI003BB71EE2